PARLELPPRHARCRVTSLARVPRRSWADTPETAKPASFSLPYSIRQRLTLERVARAVQPHRPHRLSLNYLSIGARASRTPRRASWSPNPLSEISPEGQVP